ncbi:cupin-like domain-containing protein [Actinomycetes bacterium KLBMP 9797]
MVREIPEITAAAATDLWDTYALPRRPVVVRGLFRDQPIAEAATVAGARRLLGDAPVLIKEEYSRSFAGDGQAPEPELASLDDYVGRYGDEPDSGRVVTEWDVPPTLLELFTLPEFCRPQAPVHDLFLHAFLAGPGNYAHLHFDQDQRHVLLVQVFGRKRVVVFPPSASRWLHPFGNLGSIRLQGMAPAERDAFIALAGGAQVILEPTDALFMPLLVWHFADYVDFGMSFNIRFRRNAHNRFLSADNFAGDRYVQAVSEPFGAVRVGDPLPADLAAEFARITAVHDADHPDREAKYRAMRATFRDIARQRGDGADPVYVFPLEDMDERQAMLGMRGTFRYRPDGRSAADMMVVDDRPAAGSQLRMVRDLVRRHGYPDPLFARVLANKFAKATVAELTRGEVARLVAYLQSPSGLLRAPVTV